MNTSDLIGPALDWAVAKCEDDPEYVNGRIWITTGSFFSRVRRTEYSPSTNWAQGGPIIERESIAVDYSDGTASESGEPFWCASAYYSSARPHAAKTPLIAAMRCFVTSKLGEEVKIPEELK